MADYNTSNLVTLGALQTLAQRTKDALGDYALKTDVASGIRVKGTVANFAALPADAKLGDMYNIAGAGGTDQNGVAIKAGDNVVKTETGWDNFGGTIDFSAYATSESVTEALNGKVDKVTGKQLSTEDYTTAEKTKLAGIDDDADVNVIESVKVDGTELTITDKTVNVDLSGKTDKVANATAGHIATLDTNGNLTDSGYAVATAFDVSAMITDVFGA